jgi:S-formylglutathione hydrolase FrmB
VLGRRLLGLTVLAAFVLFAGWGLFRLNRMFEPDRHGAKVTHFTVRSTLIGRSLEEIVVAPRGGGAGRPLLVLLHGRGSSPDSYLTKYWFDALAKLGSRAPDLLLVDGGDHSYYHDRADGRWGSYVLNEAIPAAVARLGADRSRIAIGGISMGGFGALLAGLRHPGAFCAVGAHSAALWHTGAETPQGAFDDAEDFDRNNILAMAASRRYPLGRDTRVWIDVGDRDPFAAANKDLWHVLQEHGGQKIYYVTWVGGHSGSYWNQHIDQYLRFYAEALADC